MLVQTDNFITCTYFYSGLGKLLADADYPYDRLVFVVDIPCYRSVHQCRIRDLWILCCLLSCDGLKKRCEIKNQI